MRRARRSARLLALACALAVAAALAGAAFAAQRARRGSTVTLSGLERGVLADINGYREAHGLRPLQISAALTEAARQHSQEMAADGYFAHDSEDGSAFWKRIQRFYGSGAFVFWSVGENLLWSSPGVSASKALRMWEHSPEHRRNLLTARWRQIGISAVHVGAGPGVFHGRPVTIVTTDFGVRR